MKRKPVINQYRSKLILEELEARQLFSGGAEGILPPPENTPPVDATVVNVDANLEPVANNPTQTPANQYTPLTDNTTSSTGTNIAAISSRHEIAFVDTDVADYQQLVDDLLQQNDANKQIEVVLLTGNKDGLEQITAILQNRQDIDAIHIFSYGRDGAVELGGVWHNTLSIDAQASQINQWQSALTDDADILLYGCNVAGNTDGELFVSHLSQLSGADIKASEDVTGTAALGGDWDLEYQAGNIETVVALSKNAQQSWAGTLDITTGLLGHWRFDANANDASGNNYNGTLTNGASIDTATGTNKAGTGKLSLDGVNDYVDLSTHRANFASLTEGTIAAWVKTTDTLGAIFNFSDVADTQSWVVLGNNGGHLEFQVIEAGTNLLQARSAATNLNDNAWHHVAVTVSTSGNKLYIDGIQAPSTYIAGNATTQSFFNSVTGLDAMLIGINQYSGGFASPLAGLVDDFRIYNRALTAADIAQLANDAPTLDNSKSPSLTSINEDVPTPLGSVGTLVSQLVDFATPAGQVDNVTDPDPSTLLGIAVTAADTTNGTWWYTTNNGSTWNALGAVSNSNARLLAADTNTRLYFQPNANYNGILSNAITFRAWDQSAGTNGSTADTSVNGGITAFSAATDTASLSVSAVNDAPSISIPSNRYTPVATAVTFSSTGGNAINFIDIDAATNPIQITISATDGTLNLATATGLTLVSGANGSSNFTYSGSFGSVKTALNTGLSFNPSPAYRGLSQITITVNDLGNTGSGGALSDTKTIDVHVGALVVTNLTDTVNGNTTSISNLIASDGGDGISLREAILAANATANVGEPDHIYFNIAGTGPHIINLASTLPDITNPVIIDASSEPNFAGTPVVVLNGGGTIQDGIHLIGGSDGSTIKGLIIQNFTRAAIDLYESNGHTIAGNWIGLDSTGTAAAGNAYGINLWNSSNNIIGGSTPAERNVVSGNSNIGILIGTDNGTSTNNQILGNYIGTDHTGNLAVGNGSMGVYINSANNSIGGILANQGNVISGTISWVGVYLDSDANNTLVAGNKIGLNAAGTVALPNTGEGIYIQSANNTIGGNTALARNIISGNAKSGITISGALATNNIVTGNYIGTDVTGTLDVNGSAQVMGASGIVIQNGASNNRIGTDADGNNDSAERNIISGNNWFGVEIINAGSNNNVVQGNYIGTDLTGLVALGNAAGGVGLWEGAAYNRIGSGLAGAGNVISGNQTGVLVANGVVNNKVQGNIIGLGVDGITVLGNIGSGIELFNGGTTAVVTGNIIGTDLDNIDDANERNIISSNHTGIYLANAEVTENIIAGNYIGTDITGNIARGNAFSGIILTNGANSNTVGGNTSQARNIISANGTDGITIVDNGTNNNIIQGNWIGINVAGNATIGNGHQGIWIGNGASKNIIGGTTNGTGNVVGGNTYAGIEIRGAGSNDNLIQGNFIGTDATGTQNFANGNNGVYIQEGASGNTVGGIEANAGNLIKFNIEDGVAIAGAASLNNAILGNSIYSNAFGIDLGWDGSTLNDLGDIDSGSNTLLNFPVIYGVTISGGNVTITGEARAGAMLEFYKSSTPAGVSGQGQTLIGRGTLPLQGAPGAIDATAIQFTYSFAVGSLVIGDSITATATSSTNNTSEFAVSMSAQAPANTAPSFSFGDGHTVTPVSSNSDSANAVAIQADGKIVTAGGTYNAATDNDIVLIRYNQDGTLDTSFGTSGIVINALSVNSDYAHAIAIQADGKILVAGTSKTGLSNDMVVLRYNADGTLDTSFGSAGIATVAFSGGDSLAQSIRIQADGKIVIAGSATVGTEDFAVVRLNSNGTLDSSFNGSGKVTIAIGAGVDQIRDIAIQEDGKIVAVGSSHNGTDLDIAVVRYNVDGSLDTSFDSDGILTLAIGIGNESANTVALQADGKILIAGLDGAAGTNAFTVVRFNNDGSLDTTFSSDGIASGMWGSQFDEAFGIAIQDDGKIIIAGELFNGTDNDVALARFNTDGTLDSTFNFDGILTTAIGTGNDSAHAIALQGDGRIVIAGYSASGSWDSAVMRYQQDGNLDLRFSLITTLDASPTYIENGSAVVLDSNVQIYDNELLSTGSFNGAALTLQRNGGANSEDQLAFDGINVTTSGLNVLVGGVQVGTYAFTSGQLIVNFGTNATQARVNTLLQNIVYSNTSDAPPTNVQINWIFSDGNTGAQGSGGALTVNGSTFINITPVNDAPVLDSSKTIAFNAQPEDSGAPVGSVGTLVSSLVDFASPSGQIDNIEDVDSGALLGIAITGADTINGTWYYSQNNGGIWNSLGSVSDTNALLLSADGFTRLYFQPNANFNGTINNAITFRAWDQSGIFSSGTYVDTSINGGNSAYSAATDTASLVVNSINDAPAASPVTLSASNEDASRLITQAELLANAADADGDPLTATGLSIVAGAGALLDNGDGTWTYTPAGNDDSAASFSYQISDGQASIGASATLDLLPANDAPTSGPMDDTPIPSNPILMPAPVLDPANDNPVSNPVKANPGGRLTSDVYPIITQEAKDHPDTQQKTNLSFKPLISTIILNTTPNVSDKTTKNEFYIYNNLQPVIENTVNKKQDTKDNGFNVIQNTDVESYNLKNHRNTHYLPKSLVIVKPINTQNNLSNAEIDEIFSDNIEKIKRQFENIDTSQFANKVEVQIMLGTTAALTAGFISWILRGGALMASLLSAIPLFKNFDPIPILKSAKTRQIKLRPSNIKNNHSDDKVDNNLNR